MENTIKFKTEDQLQAYCVKWFSENYPEWRGLLYSVPNGANLTYREANKLVATGLTAGVADLHLVLPCGKIAFIEMKLDADQSDAQIKWQKKVEDKGHVYILIRTFEQFKTIICQLIGKPY